jgi:hypothetical protein
MSPADFQRIYPSLSRQQIAGIAGCSLQTVNNWFATSDRAHRDPTEHHLLRLGLYHWFKIAPEELRDVLSIAQEG